MKLWESIFWYTFDFSILEVTTLDYIIIFFLLVSAFLLFFICFLGFFFKELSLIHVLLIFEILILAMNLLALSFSLFFVNIEGYLIFLVLLTLAAAESSLGISLLILIYKK